jgi:hypothetical protein
MHDARPATARAADDDALAGWSSRFAVSPTLGERFIEMGERFIERSDCKLLLLFEDRELMLHTRHLTTARHEFFLEIL